MELCGVAWHISVSGPLGDGRLGRRELGRQPLDLCARLLCLLHQARVRRLLSFELLDHLADVGHARRITDAPEGAQ